MAVYEGVKDASDCTRNWRPTVPFVSLQAMRCDAMRCKASLCFEVYTLPLQLQSECSVSVRSICASRIFTYSFSRRTVQYIASAVHYFRSPQEFPEVKLR